MIYAIVAVLAVMFFWVISTYNFFVSSKARIKASVQEIGNQLKRQADMIPNLEASVKGYLKHEKGIFDALTDARKAVSSAAKSGDVQKMADAGRKHVEDHYDINKLNDKLNNIYLNLLNMQ